MAAIDSTVRTDTITPTFRGIYLERFLGLIGSIDGKDPKAQRVAIQQELIWADAHASSSLDGLKYRATLMVLCDVTGQGWRTQYRQRQVFLTRPDHVRGKQLGLDHALVKDRVRESFRDERLAKINAPSTVRFIHSLENPPKGKLSVLTLVRSGAEIAEKLRSVSDSPSARELRKVVNPYLQLVRAELTDEVTGLRLLDIWRYFRYLWAISYQPTPGRNMFYLVRDSAHPKHPVIGIAALGNCVVQLSERDRIIGWSVEAVESAFQRRRQVITRDLPKNSSRRKSIELQFLESEEGYEARLATYASSLHQAIERALSDELAVIQIRGLATRAECMRPKEGLVRRLLDLAAGAETARRQQLEESASRGEKVRRMEATATDSHLYVRKRAQALADILFARMVFQREGFSTSPISVLRKMLTTDDGRKALRIGLHSNKKTKIGSSMMDIIVCGAIPPYGELLGGKLVAMLMASPQIVHDYRAAYGDQPGQIASRLAGKKVVRPAELVFLTTTSLYHVGSSQYERIRIPGACEEQVSFEHLGMTEGFGSTTLSSQTVSVLREVIVKVEGIQRINNVFGEGISPKLRTVREGLTTLGMPHDLILRHGYPRLIYGVKLARNAYEYLRGETTEPDYILRPDEVGNGTTPIIGHWIKRWLTARVRREESINRVASFKPESVALSKMIRDAAPVENTDLEDRNGSFG
jgi:hypothetical protein